MGTDEEESVCIVGGYENPDQSFPSGEGLFRFESYDLNVESFESESFEEVLKYIYRNLKPFRIVRMRGATWSVESNDEIYGQLRAYGTYLDCDRNGTSTAPSINTAFNRDGDEL